MEMIIYYAIENFALGKLSALSVMLHEQSRAIFRIISDHCEGSPYCRSHSYGYCNSRGKDTD